MMLDRAFNEEIVERIHELNMTEGIIEGLQTRLENRVEGAQQALAKAQAQLAEVTVYLRSRLKHQCHQRRIQ